MTDVASQPLQDTDPLRNQQTEPLPEELEPEQVSDVEAIRALMKQMIAQDQAQEAIDMLLDLLVRMREANTAVSVRLHNALRLLYGRRSEKISSDQMQLLFAALRADEQASTSASTDAPEPEEKKASDPRSRTTPRGAKGLPAHLPQRTREVPPDPADRVCAGCNLERVRIGEEVSKRLDFEPASFFVAVEHRPKLACPRCRDGVLCAEAGDTPIEGALPGAGLLAQVLCARFKDGLPLNRQQQIYEKRYGVRIPGSTLGSWCGHACDMIAPIAQRLEVRALRSWFIQTDDTGIRVLDRKDPRGVKRGHIWVYAAEGQDVFCKFTPTWAADQVDGPAQVLARYQGVIGCDGYAGYQSLCDPGSGREDLGCWMHARRPFEQAMQLGDQRAALIVDLIGKLYAVERKATADRCMPAERMQRRRLQSLESYAKICDLLEEWRPDVPPKTPLGKAIGYVLGRQVALGRFLDDGRLPLDNGEVERLIRTIAHTRKNFLFVGSDDAGRRAAAAYGVILSCARIGIDPWAYLRDVLPVLGGSSFPASRIDELLPQAWLDQKAEHPDTR